MTVQETKSENLYQEIIDQYKPFNENGYELFEKYESWLERSSQNGLLKAELSKTLEEVLLSLDLRKYDFCLLTIQAHDIAYDASERHYDLLLKIGHQIVRDMFSEQTPNDHAVVCIHQLMDIFFHHWNDQINPAVERNSSLVIELLEHLGTFDYKGQNLDVDIGLAVYKSFSILGALAPEVQIRLLDNVFLCHFDPEVAKEAQRYKSMVYN